MMKPSVLQQGVIMTIPRIPVDIIEGIIRPQNNEKPKIVFVLDNGKHMDFEFNDVAERDRIWDTIERSLRSRELGFIYHRNMCVRPDRLITVEPGRTPRGEQALHFCFNSGIEFNQCYADTDTLTAEYAQLVTTLAFAQGEQTNCVSFTTH
jgi:hypothetical protein